MFARNTASLEQTSRLLREKSTQLETTFIAMRDGFALLDHEGKLVVWNPQYPLLLGLPGESPQRGQQDSTLLKSVSHQDAAWLGEQRWEEALTDLRRALPQELRLAVIIGSLELTGGYDADAAAGRRIARALKAAERAAQLTQRLLAFSRKQSLSPRAVDVAALVESLHELMTHSLLPGQSLVIDAQPGLWHAWIDPGQLENALMNLVVNARDAMQGRDGDIQLRIVNQRVARSSGKQQEMVTLEVIDQGCGMPPDVRAQVFEPIFTTKEVGSGSGLGLSMVHGFIRQSGGKVRLDTAPGQGTRVQLQLRQRRPVVASSEVARLVLVLVLEDEEDVRQTLCEHLHQLGYLTIECADGERALSLLRQTPEINMLLSDLMLTGALNGVDVIRLAMQQHSAVLLVSGQDLRHRVDGALPFCERLAKPFSQRQLAQTLHRAWQRSVTTRRRNGLRHRPASSRGGWQMASGRRRGRPLLTTEDGANSPLARGPGHHRHPPGQVQTQAATLLAARLISASGACCNASTDATAVKASPAPTVSTVATDCPGNASRSSPRSSTLPRSPRV